MTYDVAIIGTGPAGGIAACRLAQAGLNTIVLEAQTLPRFKACGGLMPEGALALLGWDSSHLVKHRVNQLEYFNNFRQPHRSVIENGQLALVNRSEFDQGLIEQALLLGKGQVELLQSCAVKSVIELESHVELSGEGFKPIKARFVIAADGAVSKTARCLNLNSKRVNGVTIDAELTVSPDCYDRYCDRVLFNYYCLPQGYGWIFPKQSGVLSCGVGTWGKTHQVKAALSGFLTGSFSKGEIHHSEQHGFPIPIYAGPANIASKRVCLAGDAASLVNPVSGEGIRFAMWSGKIAAETVLELMSGQPDDSANAWDCSRYTKKVYTTMTQSLDHCLRFAALPFTQAPDLYYQRFILQSSGNPHYT